jgi:hypothetical protein
MEGPRANVTPNFSPKYFSVAQEDGYTQSVPFFAGRVEADPLFIFKVGGLIFASFLDVFDAGHEREIADLEPHVEAAVQAKLSVGDGVQLT